MYNRYTLVTPSTCEAVTGCTHSHIVPGCTVGRAVVELNLAGIGHYTPLLCILELGLQLYEVDILTWHIDVLLRHRIV